MGVLAMVEALVRDVVPRIPPHLELVVVAPEVIRAYQKPWAKGVWPRRAR